MTRPTLIKFFPQHNDDDELSCFFCTLPKCEQCFEVRGAGQSRLVGVHNDCCEKHEAKMNAIKTVSGDS